MSQFQASVVGATPMHIQTSPSGTVSCFTITIIIVVIVIVIINIIEKTQSLRKRSGTEDSRGAGARSKGRWN